MITEELYLNGKLVELAAPNSIATTYQANNIAELQNRNQDFSNVFQLPKSPRNREALEDADLLNSATVLPYRRLTARYIVDGVEAIQEGSARIVRTTDDAYHVQVTGGNASFFGLFPDLKISELIGDTLDHVNNFATVTASRSNSTGYIYPFIDWMQADIETQFQTKDVDAKSLLPCVFIKDIFQLTDELTGFDSYGALKDLPDFDNLILTPDSLERDQAAKELYNAKAELTTPQTFKAGVNWAPPETTVTLYTPIMTVSGNGFTGSTYTADVGLYGYFVFSGQATLTYKRYEFASRVVQASAEIVRDSDGAVIASEVFYSFLSVLDPSESELTVQLPYNVITNNITFVAGESYHVRFKLEDTLKGSLTIDTGEFEFCLEAAIPYGGFMPVGELFEGVTVKQIYQDVLNMYASVPISNSFQRRVRFGLMNELSDTASSAVDWSEKLHGKAYEMEYMLGKYGQKNYLRYAPDDTVQLFYGDSSFVIDDENLTDEVIAVQLSVSAVEDETRFSGVRYPRIKGLDINRKYKATNHRILLMDRKASTPYEHRYTDGVDEILVTTDLPYCTFRPLMFDTLKANYYETVIGMLTRAKIPTYRFRLTRQDVQDLDYLTPIRLDVHREDLDVSGFFYISRISNYANGFANVTLARL